MGRKSLYEQWKKETYVENLYDDDDDCGLTEIQMEFPNVFDISLRVQIKYVFY